LANTRCQECGSGCSDRARFVVADPSGRSPGIDAAQKERLRSVDVAEAAEQTLIEQRVADWA
jgi:hypothetical protein